MVTEDDVKNLFQKMHNAGWNMQKPQVWGFFFKDKSEGKLKNLEQFISSSKDYSSYDIVDINQSFPDKMYWLHIEKTCQHSVSSLNHINQQFTQLASDFGVLAYDGMDISPVDI